MLGVQSFIVLSGPSTIISGMLGIFRFVTQSISYLVRYSAVTPVQCHLAAMELSGVLFAR